MVAGEGLQLAPAQAIEARIPGPGDKAQIAANQRRHKGATHNGAVKVGLGVIQYRPVGVKQAVFEGVYRIGEGGAGVGAFWVPHQGVAG